jgi:hypothetical protein
VIIFFCLSFRNTTSLQVEKLILVYLTRCGTVAAFYVIGVNFQLGFTVNLRFFAQQKVMVVHLTVCFDGTFVDVNHAVEYAHTIVFADHFVRLMAVTVCGLMMKESTGIKHLILFRQVQTVHFDLATFGFQYATGVVSDQLTFQKERMAYHAAVTIKRNVVVTEMMLKRTLFDQFDVFKACTVAYVRRQTRTSHTSTLVQRHMVFVNMALCKTAQFYMVAVAHQFTVSTRIQVEKINIPK